MAEAEITVGDRDEDGMVAVTVKRGEVVEYLSVRFDQVGDFIASEREMEALSAEAEAAGMGVYEYTNQPFGIEYQREYEEVPF